jgi:uncharacterized membrane protein SpoIIM required for sporulation
MVMNTEFDRDEFGSYSTVSEITRVVSLAIASVVTIGIAILVTLAVLVFGVWLAYVTLPQNIFRILAVILLADIALGIVIRAVYVRRKRA